VKAEGVKVNRIRVKRVRVVNWQHSDAVRRRAQIDSVSSSEMSFSRIASSRQRRKNAGLGEAITCACSYEDKMRLFPSSNQTKRENWLVRRDYELKFRVYNSIVDIDIDWCA